MGCRECSLLSKQFSAAISRHAALRSNDLAALKVGDVFEAELLEYELEVSSLEVAVRRKLLLDHEATHGQ